MRKPRKTNFKSLALRGAHVADSKKAEDILLLDVSASSALTNYFLVLTAASTAHMHALTESLKKEFLHQGLSPLHREGRWKSSWSVMDYGGLIVHVMDRHTREFYGLERLWKANARHIRWNRKKS